MLIRSYFLTLQYVKDGKNEEESLPVVVCGDTMMMATSDIFDFKVYRHTLPGETMRCGWNIELGGAVIANVFQGELVSSLATPTPIVSQYTTTRGFSYTKAMEAIMHGYLVTRWGTYSPLGVSKGNAVILWGDLLWYLFTGTPLASLGDTIKPRQDVLGNLSGHYYAKSQESRIAANAARHVASLGANATWDNPGSEMREDWFDLLKESRKQRLQLLKSTGVKPLHQTTTEKDNK